MGLRKIRVWEVCCIEGKNAVRWVKVEAPTILEMIAKLEQAGHKPETIIKTHSTDAEVVN